MSLAVDPRAVESLLAFWADAGVEASYADQPIDRLAEGAALLRARSQPPVAVPVARPVLVSGGSADVTAAVARARASAGSVRAWCINVATSASAHCRSASRSVLPITPAQIGRAHV